MDLKSSYNLTNLGSRIGLFGGTFDPVHYGHLAAAQASYAEMSLDAVIFIPSYQPPHKYHPAILPFEDRTAMLGLAVEQKDRFYLSDIEAGRVGPSYTFDTLAYFQQKLGENRKLFFITGVDAFKEIHTWKKFNRLLFGADFIVVTRHSDKHSTLRKYIKKTFTNYHSSKNTCDTWESSKCPGKINLIKMPLVNISATEIRNIAADGNCLDKMVPKEVARYIISKNLYKK